MLELMVDRWKYRAVLPRFCKLIIDPLLVTKSQVPSVSEIDELLKLEREIPFFP